MSIKKHRLSNMDIREEYEDFVFKKVMLRYSELESEKIRQENSKNAAPDSETAEKRKKEIKKLIRRNKMKNGLHFFFSASKKVITAAAMVVLAAAVSLGTSVVASAEVRESIADYLYSLNAVRHDTHTSVSASANKEAFFDLESYGDDCGFAPTFMPEGYEKDEELGQYSYSNGETYFHISQSENGASHLDTERAQKVEVVRIGESKGILVQKDEITSVTWSCGIWLLSVRGTATEEDIIKVARGLRVNPGMEKEEVVYDWQKYIAFDYFYWEDAWIPTYMPDGYEADYDIKEAVEDFSYIRTVTFDSGTSYIKIEERYSDGLSGYNMTYPIRYNDEINEYSAEIKTENGITYVLFEPNWYVMIRVYGTAPKEELIKVAESMEYAPIISENSDYDLYNWEGAWITYLPDWYEFEIVDISEENGKHSFRYEDGEYYVLFEQKKVDAEPFDFTGMGPFDERIIDFEHPHAGAAGTMPLTKYQYDNGTDIAVTYAQTGEVLETEYVFEDTWLRFESNLPLSDFQRVVWNTERKPKTNEFVDVELYDWADSWAPTYMPYGAKLISAEWIDGIRVHTYELLGKKIILKFSYEETDFGIGEREWEYNFDVTISGCDAKSCYNLYDDFYSMMTWSNGELYICVEGDYELMSMIDIARSIRKIQGNYPLY